MDKSIFDKFPIIKLNDIVLRELNSFQDANAFFEYTSDKKVNAFLSEEDIPKSPESAKEELSYWARLFQFKHSIYWGIALKENDQLIGTCGFNNWSPMHKRAEISYDLSYNFWNKGYMTSALAEVCKFAFDKMNVVRIQATVAYDNAASIRVLEKLGFKKEGTLEKYGVLNNKQKDFYMYAKLKGK